MKEAAAASTAVQGDFVYLKPAHPTKNNVTSCMEGGLERISKDSFVLFTDWLRMARWYKPYLHWDNISRYGHFFHGNYPT